MIRVFVRLTGFGLVRIKTSSRREEQPMLEWIWGVNKHLKANEPLTSERRQSAIQIIMKKLRSMEKAEALEALVKQIRLSAPSREIGICIVLDTSFLMLERTPTAWEWLRSCSKHDVSTVYSIPNIAVIEVARHFETEKDQPARVARKRIAQLVESSAKIENLDHVRPIERTDAMSADSDTDRRIISFALAKADEQQFACVLLATDDGGIMYDIARFRRAGKRIACLTKESTTEDIFEFVCSWILQSADDAWLRQCTNV
jgi:hypothetical protein